MAEGVARNPTPNNEVYSLAREKGWCMVCVRKYVSFKYSAAEAVEVDVVMRAMALDGICPKCGANRASSN